ncbi:hypothetical protein K7X08_021970 [Anisodus acutangulus]|uniref:Uncharacterized protein n=1 Tax=Anisodus acutangulus TaxID=402998 RepID=A0A9Q1L482_9SOLA|nr:hypothetical protein K7X08_021970 [Anisodus acutangulus]
MKADGSCLSFYGSSGISFENVMICSRLWTPTVHHRGAGGKFDYTFKSHQCILEFQLHSCYSKRAAAVF